MDEPLDAPREPSGAPRRILPAVAGVLAAIFLVAGITTLAPAHGQVAEFGWFAYAPPGDGAALPLACCS